MLLASLVAAVAVAGSAPAGRGDASCTWGASSITAEWVDGKLLESEPVTSGCIPR